MKGLAYCDYIGHTIIKPALQGDADSNGGLIKTVGKVMMDLHHRDGFMLSTRKTIEVEDTNGKKYRIIIEEI